MGQYGKTPFGDPLYRIIFRDSRRHLVGGRWPDGTQEYRWVPKYERVRAVWILERWYAAMEFTHMSKLKWDCTMVDPVSGWLILGPYPTRGEYDLVWEFDQGVDNDSLEKIIGAINRGRDRSFEEIRQFHKGEYAQEERDTQREGYAEIRDAMTAFGSAPIASSRLGRGTKTREMVRTANELGLPMPQAGGGRNVGPLQISTSLIAGR